jgi:hypothetical protein
VAIFETLTSEARVKVFKDICVRIKDLGKVIHELSLNPISL